MTVRAGLPGPVWALTSAHVGTDLCQGAVPALATYFAIEHGYGLTQLASLILAVNIGSSLLQPALGLVADAVRLRWFAVVGVVIAGGGLAVVGLAPHYSGVLAATCLSGVGVALFHPEAGRLVSLNAVATRRPRAMAAFAVGGNAGFALGPLLATPLAFGLGASGIVLLGALPVLLALPLVVCTPRISAQRALESTSTVPAEIGAPNYPWAFTRLAAVITLRSSAYYALQALIPTFFVTALAQTATTGNVALSAMLTAGALATLVGGWRATQHTQMRLISWPLLASIPCLLLLPMTGQPIVAIVLVVLLGASTFAGFSPSVVLAQKYVPRRAGFASGIAFGLAPGAGSLTALGIAALAEHTRLATTIGLLAAMPLIAFTVALTLPRPASEHSAASLRC